MMGTTGAVTAGLPQKLKLLAALLVPAATDRDAYVKSTMTTLRRLASPAAEFDETTARRIIERSADRGIHPEGGPRQLAALLTQSDRTKSPRQLNISALVIHGSADPPIGISGGRATAAAIPGAELLVLDGVGHDFPRFAWPRIIEGVSRTADRGERQRRSERSERK
jgi:pimeloyl-ACP methyl ester carboxylesterase